LSHLQKSIQLAMEWKGFAFVDVISYCIENNGRRLGFKNSFEMLFKIKEDFKINSKPEISLKQNELGILKSE